MFLRCASGPIQIPASQPVRLVLCRVSSMSPGIPQQNAATVGPPLQDRKGQCDAYLKCSMALLYRGAMCCRQSPGNMQVHSISTRETLGS
jgi:hypothetical protein